MTAENLQQVYDGESALLAYLEGFPSGYFAGEPWNLSLPEVRRERFGPWADFSTPVGEKRLHVLSGIPCDSGCGLLQSYGNRKDIYEGVRGQLLHALASRPLRTKSGNRRLFGNARSLALRVVDGDLSLDLEGHAPSGHFQVDGSFELRGSVSFDTLRVYAKGPLLLRGHVKVGWLETLSEDRLEILQEVEFSGVALARHGVEITDKVKALKPYFVMNLESSGKLAGDSMTVPDFVGGELVPFEWSMR